MQCRIDEKIQYTVRYVWGYGKHTDTNSKFQFEIWWNILLNLVSIKSKNSIKFINYRGYRHFVSKNLIFFQARSLPKCQVTSLCIIVTINNLSWFAIINDFLYIQSCVFSIPEVWRGWDKKKTTISWIKLIKHCKSWSREILFITSFYPVFCWSSIFLYKRHSYELHNTFTRNMSTI